MSDKKQTDEAAAMGIPYDGFLASLFEANAKSSAAATNQVIDNLERDLAEVRKNYADLFRKVDELNMTALDSMRLARILDNHAWRIDR